MWNCLRPKIKRPYTHFSQIIVNQNLQHKLFSVCIFNKTILRVMSSTLTRPIGQYMCFCSVFLLMYANDTAVSSETPESLQATLDQLYEYCNKWGLKLNTTKTKVLVFRKRGRLRQHEQWSYSDESLEIVDTTKTKVLVLRKRGRLRQHEQWSYSDERLEIVDTFNYRGTVFSNNGKWSSNQQMLVAKALKAMKCLLYNLKITFFHQYLCTRVKCGRL